MPRTVGSEHAGDPAGGSSGELAAGDPTRCRGAGNRFAAAYGFTQPHHGGAYGQGEIVGTIAMVVTFGGFGLYKLLKR